MESNQQNFKNSLVSVIIPVFNASSFIEDTVKSVIDFAEVGEVILVDDGSTDGSYEKCKKLESELDKVRLLSHKDQQNLGAANSRNLGIQSSYYSYISFLDADDIYFPNRFESSIKALETNKELDACFGSVEVNFEETNSRKLMGALSWSNDTSLLSYLLNGGYFHTNAITIKKSFFLKTGYFNQSCWPHEDSELWIRMAALGTIEKIIDEKPIASYRIHKSNLSRSQKNNTRLIMYRIVLDNSNKLGFSFYQKILVLKQILKSIMNV